MALEIVLPETKPETEWVRDRALQKVSPTRDHGRLQMRVASALDAWARGRGEVATEWRFRLQPAGEPRRPLVPDVAYLSYERMRGRTHAELQAPTIAPNVVVEILSPDDDPQDVTAKTLVYLGCGVELVIEIDPDTRTAALYDGAGALLLASGDLLCHVVLPGFELDLGDLFRRALDVYNEYF